jgi:hypothetical protein
METLKDAEKALGTPIAKRYFVVEVTPSVRYDAGDGHGGTRYDWTREKSVVVSPYFDTAAEAKAWMDKHEPDEGKGLVVKHQTLYEKVVRNWH